MQGALGTIPSTERERERENKGRERKREGKKKEKKNLARGIVWGIDTTSYFCFILFC
jgi:hypothetical protein